MIKIEFYVPVDSAEVVKAAMFNVGAGKIGKYEKCSWETNGTGQFRPLDGSNPTIGKIGKTEKINELKVEMVCEDHLIDKVIHALKQAHPYETPAYSYWKVES